MHFWNRDNFEGLAELAVSLRDTPALESLARYCELREQGLRSQAFACLDEFLDQASTWASKEQRETVITVLEASRRVPSAHQFLSHPLRVRFVEPILKSWREEEPHNALPLRELALLGRERALLEEALRLDPGDELVRAVIVSQLLDFVDYATHHLVESHFIGSETDAVWALDEAARLLARSAEPVRVEHLKRELLDLRRLVDDWNAYRANPEGSFPEWCANRDKQHAWSTIAYYTD